MHISLEQTVYVSGYKNGKTPLEFSVHLPVNFKLQSWSERQGPSPSTVIRTEVKRQVFIVLWTEKKRDWDGFRKCVTWHASIYHMG